MNPIRAGMTGKAEEWLWSNYRAMIGIGKPPALLSVDWILEQYGPNKKTATANFKQYVVKGIGGEYPVEALRAGLILGSGKFVEKIQGLIEEKRGFAKIPRCKSS